METHKYSSGLSFLHIPHSSISRVIETHRIPKTWEHWILIVRETYGKTQTFQSYRSLKYFMWGINSYNSQNMGKVNSHSNEKIWENKGISDISKGFLYFSLEGEVRAVSKTWKNGISIVREKYRKRQTFQIYGFLKYFGWNRNPYNFQNMGKVNSYNTRKVWEKNIRKFWVSQMFWVKQKSIQFSEYGKSEFP